jgi:hypothetical protein
MCRSPLYNGHTDRASFLQPLFSPCESGVAADVQQRNPSTFRSFPSVFVLKMTHFHELSDLNGFQQWFFKTRMSFFGMDLALPWWFGVSSWHYAIYGIVMLLVEPPWAKKSRFPYRATAFAMIFLQGECRNPWMTYRAPNHNSSNLTRLPISLERNQAPLSFLADYVFMTDDSIIHVMDRAMATPAAAIEVGRVMAYVANNVSSLMIIATLVVELTAMYCFLQSAKAQADLNRDNFVFWHFSWHCYPLVASLLVSAEFYQRQFEIRRLDLKLVESKVE